MAEKKITKREKFEMLLDMVKDNDMLTEFIKHEIELLSRKGSKSAKLTPAQADAVAIAEIIRDILANCEDEKGMTVGAILQNERIQTFKRYNGERMSSQVITSIVSKNKEDFRNTVEKKVSYYALNYGIKEEDEEVGE